MVSSAKYQRSTRYTEIMDEGYLKVVYACDGGRERSQAALWAAEDRGEHNVSIMKNGMWGLVDDAGRSPEKIVTLLQKRYAGCYLRLIMDGRSHPGGIEKLVKQAGIAFEIVECGDLRREAEACGQDWREYFD